MRDERNNQKIDEGEPKLYCIACGARAELIGKCCNAKVVCNKCGAVWPVSMYEDDIKKIKEYYIKVACALENKKD